MAERYRSGALAAAHETARALTEAGAMAKRTMKVFDDDADRGDDAGEDPRASDGRMRARRCSPGIVTAGLAWERGEKRRARDARGSLTLKGHCQVN